TPPESCCSATAGRCSGRAAWRGSISWPGWRASRATSGRARRWALDAAETGAARVLIVEDNPANLLLTRAVLQRAGYRTAEAHSAEEALHLVQLAQPDLILMDVQLPGQDGLSLTRQLKADPLTAAIPIVALTAHAMS